MTAYDLMIKTNHHLIKGGDLTEPQKANIVRQFLDAQSTPEQVQRFHRGVMKGGDGRLHSRSR